MPLTILCIILSGGPGSAMVIQDSKSSVVLGHQHSKSNVDSQPEEKALHQQHSLTIQKQPLASASKRPASVAQSKMVNAHMANAEEIGSLVMNWRSLHKDSSWVFMFTVAIVIIIILVAVLVKLKSTRNPRDRRTLLRNPRFDDASESDSCDDVGQESHLVGMASQAVKRFTQRMANWMSTKEQEKFHSQESASSGQQKYHPSDAAAGPAASTKKTFGKEKSDGDITATLFVNTNTDEFRKQQ
eukprot:gnl/MRDRNA2_/MRDRNA2_73257_c0_seq2.p1 gnl/MRDRNA2_/MRDRNA2_73257_c0~~gnl/MRDRNA2_/MRDRNA2_73257_c0_seq2.p1  ORF type:complete len:243 (+),score=45.81 gnl/MRDRNA2_/MRDRNA2_73257_c0_seq2:180-908(+)